MTQLLSHAAPFRSVGIELQPRQRALYLGLARILKERHGSEIHFYVRSDDELRGLERMGVRDLCDSLSNDNVMRKALKARDLDEAGVVARARAYETKIGETVNALTFSHRQLGRGFSPGSFNYPRARYASRASYVQMLHAYGEVLAFWEREIRDRRLTLLIDGGKEMACMARAQGLPYRWLQSARYKTYWQWTVDEFQTNPAIAWHHRNLPPGAEEHIEEIYRAATAKYRRVSSERALHRLLPRLGYAAARQLALRALGYQKAEGATLRDLVSFPLRARRDYRRVARLSRTALEDLDGRPFVYFPLHKEPETALLLAAPEYSFQHALVLAVARDLPAGVPLVVKENLSAIGRRPDDFYAQIAELKNVAFLRLDTPPLETVKRAAATITINGTAGMEAATLGRPVIAFNPRVPYRILPHVMTASLEPASLRPCLERALSGRIDLERAKRDGARYLAAVVASAMDLGPFLLDWSADRGATRETALIAYRGLVASFDPKFEAAPANAAD